MKSLLISFIILVSIAILQTNSIAQNKDWKTQLSKDGKITVKSRVIDEINEKGEKVQLVQYVATTTANVSLSNCISVLKNVTNHHIFLDKTVKSSVLKIYSSDKWLIYYYLDGKWPVPNSDIVSIMKYEYNQEENIATFTINSAPTLYKSKGVKRSQNYNITYTFKKTNIGVKITLTSSVTPFSEAPDWLIKSWFPDGPVFILNSIIDLAKKE